MNQKQKIGDLHQKKDKKNFKKAKYGTTIPETIYLIFLFTKICL